MSSHGAKVFISYSHKDAGIRKRLDPFLSTTVKEALWIDEHKIDYGDRFDDKIRDALKSAKLGILLVSPHFFASEYVRTKELPFLVEQAERNRVSLGILFLTATPASPRTIRIEVDGVQRAICLEKTYDCFTTPDKPLDRLDPADRNEIFARIADWAERKIVGPEDRTTQPNREAALAIRLRRHGKAWDRLYVLPDRRQPSPPPDPSGASHFRPRSASGEALFAALFGDDDGYHQDLFGELFGASGKANPTFGRLRIRLLLEDDRNGNELALAPWSSLCWRSRPLAECGWSVELRHTGFRVNYPDPIDHAMDFPDRVVALAGDGYLAASHLTEDLPRFFDRYWQQHVPFELCSAVDQFEEALHPGARLVYYFGPADAEGLRLAGDTPLEWPRLAEILGRVGTVSLVYLNLPDFTAVDAVPAGRQLIDKVRGAVLFHCSDAGLAPQAANRGMAWLQAVLLGEGDPIDALHRENEGPVHAWSRYTHFSLGEPPPHREDPDFVNLFLDREKQRHDLLGVKNDFLHGNQRQRIHHVVACGEQGNRTAEFPRAVQAYLRKGRDRAELFFREEVRLDPGLDTDVDRIDTRVRRRFGWRPDRGIEDALLSGADKPGPDAFCYLVLHWHLERPIEDPDVAAPVMEAAANWLARYLAAEVAAAEQRGLNLRVFSILTAEAANPAVLDGFEQTIEEDLQIRDYDSPAFHFGDLKRLAGVRKNDLKRFFDDARNCRCSEAQRREFPDLLLGGLRELRFDLAVETIRRGFPDNLGGLFEELEALRKKGAWPPAPEHAADFWTNHDRNKRDAR